MAKRLDGKKRATTALGRKHRRKTELPTRRVCDRLWSQIIHLQHNSKLCPICGSSKYRICAHHLIPRQFYEYRWDTNNAICVCNICHRYGAHAIHISPWFFEEWLKNNKPTQYQWWILHRNCNTFSKDGIDYSKVYLNLMKEYRIISGDIVITYEDEEEICKLYMSGDYSTRELGRKFKINPHTVAAILKDHNIKITDRLTQIKKPHKKLLKEQ